MNSQSRILWTCPSVCRWSPPPHRCPRKSRNISEVTRRWCDTATRRQRSWCKSCPSPWWGALFLKEPRRAGPETAANSCGLKNKKRNNKTRQRAELYAPRSEIGYNNDNSASMAKHTASSCLTYGFRMESLPDRCLGTSCLLSGEGKKVFKHWWARLACAHCASGPIDERCVFSFGASHVLLHPMGSGPLNKLAGILLTIKSEKKQMMWLMFTLLRRFYSATAFIFTLIWSHSWPQSDPQMPCTRAPQRWHWGRVTYQPPVVSSLTEDQRQRHDLHLEEICAKTTG